MAVDPFSEPISKLSDAVIYVAKTTANFKPQLKQLKHTLDRITPIFDDINNLNRILDRSRSESDMFVDEIQDAKKLVFKCLKIKWNYFKRFTHSLKLKELNEKLLRFFQIEVQADQSRDIKQTLVEVNYVSERLTSLDMTVKSIDEKLSCGSMSMSWRRYETLDRHKLGWAVPPPPKGVVAFDEPLQMLKAKILAGIDDGYDNVDDGSLMDCDGGFDSVVVVSAAGGCGKTTLAKMLCSDTQIQDKFGENIFFVTVSENPNFMVMVNDLFNPDSFGQTVSFQGNEDAKNKLENFFSVKVSCPILVVLDDVWSDSFIKNFEFGIKGYKLLVTSRMVFPRYDVFKFDPLSDEDAKILFHRSARPSPTIDENLVNQMVKCCKRHPLTLSVVGSSLVGKDETIWRYMQNVLSKGHSVLNLNEEILNRLETSFQALDEKFKDCFLDFGLFLEDQRIPASALLNMWVHLYKHDDEGNDTLAKIFELSYRNLVNLMTTGNNQGAMINYCEQQYVTQHDLLRQLAINLNSQLPITQRPRLIISAQEDQLITNVRAQDRPAIIEQVQELMQARILSISTGESFSSQWCNMRVPEVEVMVLNLMSKSYTLPPFLKEMQKLKILNITNYGLYPTKFENFNLLGCLSNLMRIRLERVTVSSLSRSTLSFENLQKVSFIMCKIGKAFEEVNSDNLNVWPRIVEIEMDYCQDLAAFPGMLCNSIYLKKLSITNCNEMCEISEEFGKLSNLETLSLHSCTKLEKLPESITRLQKLSVLDISDCLSLNGLPELMGNLGGLRTIYMKGCTGVHELPLSVNNLSNTQVVCNEEMSYQWREFKNVEIDLVEEDRLESLLRII